MSETNQSSAQVQAYSEPLVTIGLPTYNRPAGLQKALENILKQTYSNLEIIISDNCSTDAEVSGIILNYAAKDNRIRDYRQNENIGLEENFNFVYAKANGQYFIWMSDDDYFDASYITECVRFLQDNPGHVLCSGQALYYDDGEFSFKENMMPLCQESSFLRTSKFFSQMQQNGKFYGLFRNKLLASAPLGKHIGCDWSFTAKLAMLGKITYTNKTNYHRAVGGNSFTRKKMVERFGYGRLKNIFLETYMAYIISTNIFNDLSVKYKLGYIKRHFLVVIIFFKIHRLLIINSIRKRIKKKKYQA